MALTIGELVGFLKIDDSGWRRGLAAARAALAKASADATGEVDALTTRVDQAGASFVRLALTVSKVVGAAAGLQGSAALVGQVGAAVAVLPAVGVAAAAGMVALKVGMAGFGDAMKNVGDPAKFAESLERLSPAAREAAIAVRDLGPQWRTVQQTVQEALFAGVARDIRALGSSYLPVLETGLSGIAGEFNTAARATARFLGQSQQVTTVGAIFGNVRASIGDTSSALQPLVSILLDVVAVGSEFLPGLSEGFGSAAQRAAEFVREARETGQLHAWIASGLATLRQLGALFGNVAAIASSVFQGLDLGGAGLLGTLVALTGQVREFLASVQGQQALAAFGQVLATVSDVVTEVLLTALYQLAPVVMALAPGFAQLATQVGSVLVAALTVAGPLLTQLATFLSANVSWLGPLAIGLYGAAQAFDAVTTAVRFLNIVSAVNPWLVIITATIALATLIISNWDTITSAVASAWQWLVDRAAEFWGWIDQHIVQHLSNAVGAVRDGVGNVLDFFGWLASLPGRVADWFGGVRDGAIRKLGELVEWVKGLPGRIVGGLGDLGRRMWDAGVDAIRGLLDGLGSMARRVIDWFRNLIDSAVDAALDVLGIASPSKVFRRIGVWSGQGLVDGLRHMVDPVTGAASALADAAVPSPALATPPGGLAATASTPATSPTATNAGGWGGAQGRSPLHIEHYHAPPDADPAAQAEAWDWLARGGG